MQRKVEYVLWIVMCFSFDRISKLFPESLEIYGVWRFVKYFSGGRDCNAMQVSRYDAGANPESYKSLVLSFQQLDIFVVGSGM